MDADEHGLGGWSIDPLVYEELRAMCPCGTVVELGSGRSTSLLAEHYELWSVEHDKRFLREGPYNQVYAPLKDGWYDPLYLKGKLPARCDVLLVDGPPVKGRSLLLKHLTWLPIPRFAIIDDTNREEERKLAQELFFRWRMKTMERFHGRLGKTEFVVMSEERRWTGL